MEETSFGDSFRSESKSPQSLLEKVSPFFPNKVLTVVSNRTQKTKLKYFYDFTDSSSWWSKPGASDTFHPQSLVRDTYGYFAILNTPTINRNWKFSTLPEESIEHQEDSSDPRVSSSLFALDPLHKFPVPIGCLEEEFELFFHSDPLASYRPHTPTGGKAGRFFTLDPEVWANKNLVRVEGSTLLPSLEFKTRKAAVGGLSVLDMLKSLNDRSRPLLENWNKEFVWDKVEGIKKVEVEDIESAVGSLTLEESISKEDLRDELLLRTRVSELAITLLNHQHGILKAEHVEIKSCLRAYFLSLVGPKKNPRLAESLLQSRFSSPNLFGKIPESFIHKIHWDQMFAGFSPPNGLIIPDPSKRKKFLVAPSDNRGSVRSVERSFSQRPSNRQRGGR